MEVNRNASAVAFQRYGVKSNMDDSDGGGLGLANVQEHMDGGNPLSSGSSTFGSVAQTTAWRASQGSGSPLSYSKQTRGTTLNFEDAPSRPQVEG